MRALSVQGQRPLIAFLWGGRFRKKRASAGYRAPGGTFSLSPQPSGMTPR